MATCYKCNSFKSDFGDCPNCAKIDADKRLAEEKIKSDRRLAEEKIESDTNLANRNMKLQLELAKARAEDSDYKHYQLMEQEEKRLQELKKQTQILLEQGLTLDEVYEIGFNFEESNLPPLFNDNNEPWAPLGLDERGNIVARYDSPYVQEKFRKAFQKGVEDRLKKDYSKGPGVEFMTEAAFNFGYSRTDNATIFFPNKNKQRFFFSGLLNLEYLEYVNDQDGSIEVRYENPYDSDILNQSFKAGINKYLAEKNSLEEKSKRLSLIKQKNKIERQTKIAIKKFKANQPTHAQIIEASQKKKLKLSNKDIGNSIAGALIGAITGAITAIPIYFFVWFFSIFAGGTSVTLIGFVEIFSVIFAFVGFFVGKKA